MGHLLATFFFLLVEIIIKKNFVLYCHVQQYENSKKIIKRKLRYYRRPVPVFVSLLYIIDDTMFRFFFKKSNMSSYSYNLADRIGLFLGIFSVQTLVIRPNFSK